MTQLEQTEGTRERAHPAHNDRLNLVALSSTGDVPIIPIAPGLPGVRPGVLPGLDITGAPERQTPAPDVAPIPGIKMPGDPLPPNDGGIKLPYPKPGINTAEPVDPDDDWPQPGETIYPDDGSGYGSGANDIGPQREPNDDGRPVQRPDWD